MFVRPLYVVALCLGLVTHACLSAVVYSDDGQLAEEERLDKARNNVYEHLYTSTSQSAQILSEKLKPEDNLSSVENSSSEESKSHKHTKTINSEANRSKEDSSSEEQNHTKTICKRSLDSKQDPVNTIGEGFNQTYTKQNSGVGTNETQTLEAINSNESESTKADVKDDSEIINQTSTLANEAVTESTKFSGSKTHTESSTLENDPVFTTESETTTEIAPETTVETESESIESVITTETEFQTTTETESGTTLKSQSETVTESESATITTTEITDDSSTLSEDKDDETPQTTEMQKSEETQEQTFMEAAIARVNKLSDQIRLVLMNYRKDKVVVLPGQSFFPDPMAMQDFKQSFSIGTIDFKNMNVYGLSNFTVEHINTDVDRMQVYILLHMKRLVILGNYTLRTFFSRASGPFNVTLLDVDSEGVAEIETASEGHLEATDSEMDMHTQDMKVDFKNLGFMGSMFQGMVSAVGDALFDSIKPQILERVNLVIRTDVNKKLRDFSVKFINKVSPVDLAFSEGRKYARSQGYDPYKIRDHNFVLGGLVYINITEFWVEGLSKFYRVGNLSLSMDSGIIQIGVHVMTQKLTGHCIWSGQTFGIVKSGKTNFTVDHLQVRALVNQSLDIRQKPQLDELDLELGWVKVTMDSPMTLNMMIEGIINAFPRLIRHIIVDALEQPLKEKIQEILDKINIEAFVDDNLPRLDSFGL